MNGTVLEVSDFTRKVQLLGRVTKTEEDQNRRRILMMANEGMAAPEIAEALGLSPVTVYRYRDKYDIPIREASRGRKPEENRDSDNNFSEKVLFLASAGATVSDVSMKLGVPSAVVKAVARKNNIKIQGLN